MPTVSFSDGGARVISSGQKRRSPCVHGGNPYRKNPARLADAIEEVRRAERVYAALDDAQLREAAKNAVTLPQVVAVTTLLASRAPGLRPVRRAARRRRWRWPTGRSSRCRPARARRSPRRAGDRVARARGQGRPRADRNDYLARRDAGWMGGIYDARPVGRRRPAAHDERGDGARAYRAATSPTPPPTKSASTTCAISSRSTAASRSMRPFARAVIDEADSVADRRSADSAGDRRRRPPKTAIWPRAPIAPSRRLRPCDYDRSTTAAATWR